MARSRGGSRPAPRPAAPRAPSRPASSVPAQQQRGAPPAPQQQQSSGGGLMSGMASTIAQGFSFGIGSAVAHRAVGAAANAMTGGGESQQQVEQYPPQQQYQQAPPQQYGAPACSVDAQNFQACLQSNPGNVDACQFLYEALNQCQRQAQFQ